MSNKIKISKEQEGYILSNVNLSVVKLAENTAVSIGVVKRVLRENGINKFKSKADLYLSKIPKTAIKKEFFNFDVYSSGHIINRNTGQPTIFKTQKRMRIINGVSYPSVEKKSDLWINHKGVKKTITISLAKLIGILFVPNEDRLQNIRYKSGGKFNCDANNLEWSSLPPQAGRIKIIKTKLDKHYKSLNENELHHSDWVVYEYYKTKDLLLLYSFFKKENRFFKKVMIKEWITSVKTNKPNYAIIDDLISKFLDELPSLIDRGFFAPKINKSWFILYCLKHLKGRVKNFIFRESPKLKSLDSLSNPKSFIMNQYSDRVQKHNFG